MVPVLDSYSSFEHRFLDRGRWLVYTLLKPAVFLLTALGVSPNVVSLAQVGVGVIIVFTVTSYPRLTFLLFLLALLLDSLDGTLARHTGRASPFGALLDQYCDHGREILVIAALARAGALSPFPAVLYALAYPALNLTLYLCNYHRVPLPLALKSYLVVYPALFAYLWFGSNWLDEAVSLSIGLMGLVVVQGLFHLRWAIMEIPGSGRGYRNGCARPARACTTVRQQEEAHPDLAELDSARGIMPSRNGPGVQLRDIKRTML